MLHRNLCETAHSHRVINNTATPLHVVKLVPDLPRPNFQQMVTEHEAIDYDLPDEILIIRYCLCNDMYTKHMLLHPNTQVMFEGTCPEIGVIIEKIRKTHE